MIAPRPVADAQNGEQAEPPEIPDEPKTVDPATLMPPKLAAKVTVNFEESSLREMAQWIEEEQEIPVLFDTQALAEEGIPLGEPVTDRLDNEPLYLVLNRLTSLGLAWYVEDEVLHITTALAVEERLTTETYNVGDLLDAGYRVDDLTITIENATEGPWSEIDGEGGEIQWLGDVLFVRQTDHVQRRVGGLLAALRNHGRQTFILDPPQHMALREKLDQNVSVKFSDIPLALAVRRLAEQTGVDIRLDDPALREEGIRDREPVSLTLPDRKLRTVLQVMLADLGLTWILRDGVLWITPILKAEESRQTAVYDVRDLCRDREESGALTAAIQSQTAGPWEEIDGEGGVIEFPRPGTMVVRQTESGLREVLQLLETYRAALRTSKPRDRGLDPQEVITRYYRMHAKMADGLAELLPKLVQPDTWRSEQKPDAPGHVLRVPSEPKLMDEPYVDASGTGGSNLGSKIFVVPQAVLIIRQTRATHEEIVEVVRRVQQGDPQKMWFQEDFRGGVGGGFGGGFFSTD